jgi:L-ascorbate metabolism protein UlaG (beta-lactamase superfamily)
VSAAPAIEVAWLGHATVDIRLDGTRLVTDPVLRDHVAHLRRLDGTSQLAEGPVDAVLLSHLHHDHLDIPSLRRLRGAGVVVVPRGGGRLVARHARAEVVEVDPEDVIEIEGLRVQVVPADHRAGRALRRVQGAPVGYLVEGASGRVYFPGDTDLHPVMDDLPAPDVALLPIWGWGPTIGPGHLDPQRAAEAAARLRARAVLPVHWGTFAPRTSSRQPDWLRAPGETFADAMAAAAPGVDLRVVRPGPNVLTFPGPAPA